MGDGFPILGATPAGPGLVAFRVWAPQAQTVAVRVREIEHALERRGDGVWEAELDAVPGDDYSYVLDGGDEWPDPCSRWQPEGIRGPSRVLDTAFPWTDDEWRGVSLDALVLYELHVGTFTEEGTLDAAVARLDELAELGITAVELMPVGEFPGEHGWGYDGVHIYAVHHAYGGPQALSRFVDAAHRAGLAVILDVVYNHIGPGNERISAFGPYFTDRYETFWGQALDYSQGGVREWALQNAEYWVRDFHVDGFRLDATHAVFDDESPQHVLAELAQRVRALNPRTFVTSEMETGDLRPIGQWGHDAQWADEFHHELHVLLTREQEGYYSAYRGSVEDLAAQYRRTPPERLVICSQNHDQVGNRAFGDRPAADELSIRAACLLFAPQTPLLFQGEEYGERRPFQFFTDHIDPAIAEATRQGRRKEFERFAAFAGEDVPDPQDPETFRGSKLDPSAADEDIRTLYRELLRLRRVLPKDVEARAEGDVLYVRRGPVELVADFGARTVELRR